MNTYKPIPGDFVNVEAGHYGRGGAPLIVTTIPVGLGEDLGDPDPTADAIVVTLKDFNLLAEQDLGVSDAPSDRRYALHIGPARKLAIALLFALAHCGDPIAGGLLDELHNVNAKYAELLEPGTDDEEA